jgi:hypothetical protein
MRFWNAESFRFMAQAAHNKKQLEAYKHVKLWEEKMIRKHQPLIHEVYTRIQKEAEQGKVSFVLEQNHPFWKVDQIHWLFVEKGFLISKTYSFLSWAKSPKDKQLQ